MTNFYSTQKWKEVRGKALCRDRYTCQECGYHGNDDVITYGDKVDGKRSLVAHHIKPKKQGGTDSLENLVTVCAPCHVQIEKRMS